MREIKFKRAFYFDEQKTKFSHYNEWGVNIKGSIFTSPSVNNFAPYYTDYQYTGLKDKNGKEIYEGNIIKNQVRKKYKIVFKNYSFYFKSITNNEQYNFELYIKMLEKANVKKIEIIGDIHEPQINKQPKI